MKEIFDRHHVGRAYLEKNYKEALMSLEKKGQINANPPASERRAKTFADKVVVTFPAQDKSE